MMVMHALISYVHVLALAHLLCCFSEAIGFLQGATLGIFNLILIESYGNSWMKTEYIMHLERYSQLYFVSYREKQLPQTLLVADLHGAFLQGNLGYNT